MRKMRGKDHKNYKNLKYVVQRGSKAAA